MLQSIDETPEEDNTAHDKKKSSSEITPTFCKEEEQQQEMPDEKKSSQARVSFDDTKGSFKQAPLIGMSPIISFRPLNKFGMA